MRAHPHSGHGHGHGHGPERIFQGRGSRFYDRVARWLGRGLYGRIADDIADAAVDEGDVLDIGTGPGVLVDEIARRRRDLRLTGIDLSEDMIAAAQRNLEIWGSRANAHVGDVTELPFPDDSFDLIVTSFSLHHWEDPQAAVPELARVLRPGGRLYIYDFRFAPFETIVDTARAQSVLTGRPARRTQIRTGVPLLPRCVRQVLSAAPTTPGGGTGS
ncbi:class I SAM-dependent methyltransferase [Salinactinospora qingdaonensis]|uniref:Methyltransferase type 11 domain-containing protein n=1 Tax=Salinactinospora qingdaonensis TaxID=702744 RepID=A0ABP7F645_9ACTN